MFQGLNVQGSGMTLVVRVLLRARTQDLDGSFRKRGTYYSTLNSRILATRTPK